MSAAAARALAPAEAGPRLRVAQVVTRMDVGGVPDHVMTLVRALSGAMDFTVVCASIDPAHERELAALGIEVVPVPMRRLLSPARDLKGLRDLAALFRARRFDLVHSHMSKAALIGGAAARLAGVPVCINTAHNLGFLALSNLPARLLFWAYDKALFSVTADAVVTVSERVRDGIVGARIAPSGKVVPIHNGIDTAKFESAGGGEALRREFGIAPEAVLIVTVARLVWFKGLRTLVEAAGLVVRDCPEAAFLVVGEGPEHGELEAQARALGLERHVRFAGPRRDVPTILAAADIFALPSVSEGLPISILEAMASAKPVVATAVGGIPELVEPERSGLLVPPRDAPALAAALTRLVKDAGLRAAMGACGHARAAERFSPQRMAARTANLYRALVADKQARRR